MRVASVIGTRPQIIKSAPIVHAAKDFPGVELLVVHTGQHYDYGFVIKRIAQVSEQHS